MAKICPKCGVDLALKKHRPNCPTRRATTQPVDNTLVINPVNQNEQTTKEVGDSGSGGGGTVTIDPPSDSGGMAGGSMDSFSGGDSGGGGGGFGD